MCKRCSMVYRYELQSDASDESEIVQTGHYEFGRS